MADKEIVINISTTADTAELEDLSTKVAELKENADTASDAMDNLGDSTEQVNSDPIEQAKENTREFGEEAEKAKDEVQEMQGSLDLIESSAMLDLANNIGSIGSNAENMAQGMNTAAISVGQLSTNVGMAEPQMVNLINYISNATFPQNEAMAYVNALNQMGVSANNLGDAATNMDRINDATGIGYQKTMELTQGLRAVGISAENIPSSFNAIAYAQANVNGGAGTLSQVLKTQAATINEYGLNVDQLVLIMQRLSEQGVQGRKMGSELSKVLKETNGDTAALEQSLGLATGSLSNASDATGQYAGQLQNLANEEMEHKSFIDQLGAAWEDFSLSLTPVISPMASVIGLVGQFGQFAMQVNGIVKLAQTLGLLQTAEGALIPVQIAEGTAGWFSIGWIALAIALGIALGLALIYLYEHSEQFRMAIDWLGQTIMWLVQMAWTNLMALFTYIQQLGTDLLNIVGITGNDMTSIIVGVLAFIATLPIQLGIIFANAIAKALGFGDNFVQDLWNAAVNSVTKFGEGIAGLSDKLKEELDDMLKQAEDFALNIPHPIFMAAKAAKMAWQNGTGENSPGDMYDMFTGELEAMENAPLVYGPRVVYNVASMATNMVGNYEHATTGMTAQQKVSGSVAGGDINVTFEGCTFDKEERVNEVLDILNNYFNWNNMTAGRTN